MPFPDKLLLGDEDVVENLHPHWITVAPAVGGSALVLAAMTAALVYVPSDWGGHAPLVIVMAAVLVLLRTLLVPMLQWRCAHYVVTTTRVLLRTGVLHHTGRDIALTRISDVSFDQSLLDRIVNAGTVTIESAGEQGQSVLTNVPNSDRVQQVITGLVGSAKTQSPDDQGAT